MTVKICKNCKWWTGNSPPEECRGKHACEHKAVGNRVTGVQNNIFADDPYCVLITGPHFGCIHFSKREEI